MTEYLDPTRLREVRDTAIRVLAEPQLRPFLFEGIMHEYFTTLPIQTSPAWQIRSDLGKLNTVERLVDSTVPLEIWLYNAAGLTSEAGARAVFQQAKDIVTAASSGAPDVGSAADPAELPEAYIFSDDTVAFPFLAAGVTAGASVGRLAVPPFESGAPKLTQTGAPEPPHGGTGWLVAPTLLMTNHHVVNARSRTNGALELAGDADLRLQAAHTVVSFDFDSDPPSGQPIISTDVSCIALVAADPDLDYAILRIPENAARPALALWPRKIAATVDDNLPVNVIQHPAGKAKRIGLRNNIIYTTTDRDLRYFTDTAGGASGSPVLTDNWQVCGLHRASARVNLTFQGKPSAYVNIGTQISVILAHLQEHFPAVHNEIASLVQKGQS